MEVSRMTLIAKEKYSSSVAVRRKSRKVFTAAGGKEWRLNLIEFLTDSVESQIQFNYSD